MKSNSARVTLWALAWAASFLAVTFGTTRESVPFGLTLAGVILTAVLGVATVAAYHRFLQSIDELRRKIEIEALAFAFGLGAIVGPGYWLLARSGAVSDAGIVYVFAAMILAHPLGILIGQKRYS